MALRTETRLLYNQLDIT